MIPKQDKTTDAHKSWNPQQNISKSSSSVHWMDQTSQWRGIYPRDIKMIQHAQINKCDINRMRDKNQMVISAGAMNNEC